MFKFIRRRLKRESSPYLYAVKDPDINRLQERPSLDESLSALEPRYLFDAAGVATGAEVAGDAEAANQADAAMEAVNDSKESTTEDTEASADNTDAGDTEERDDSTQAPAASDKDEDADFTEDEPGETKGEEEEGQEQEEVTSQAGLDDGQPANDDAAGQNVDMDEQPASSAEAGEASNDDEDIRGDELHREDDASGSDAGDSQSKDEDNVEPDDEDSVSPEVAADGDDEHKADSPGERRGPDVVDSVLRNLQRLVDEVKVETDSQQWDARDGNEVQPDSPSTGNAAEDDLDGSLLDDRQSSERVDAVVASLKELLAELDDGDRGALDGTENSSDRISPAVYAEKDAGEDSTAQEQPPALMERREVLTDLLRESYERLVADSGVDGELGALGLRTVSGESARSLVRAETVLSRLQGLIAEIDGDVPGADDDIDSAAPRDIVFVDTSVENYESLLEGIDGEIRMVTEGVDGLAYMADALEGGDYTGVHVLGHGAEGRFTIGGTVLTAENLDGYVDEFGRIGDAMARGGELLLYGCDIAAGHDGESFVEQVSELAGGVDVAASVDDTGSAELGGDWHLEYSTGSIETSTIEATGFSALLQSATFSQEPGDQTIDEDTSLDFSSLNLEVTGGDSDMIAVASIDSGTGQLSNAGVSAPQLTATGSLSDINDFLDGLTYTPAADATETATITISVDQDDTTTSGFESQTSFSIDITPQPDSPNLSGDATLDPVDEDTSEPPGETVSNLVGGLFEDVDSGDQLAGVAVSDDASDPASGVWQYQVSGSSDWTNIDTVSVSQTNALLLAGDTSLRFDPAPDFNGDVGALTIHAVDDSAARTFTDGTTEQHVDVTDPGNTDTDDSGNSLDTSINAVPDPFTVTADTGISVDEGASKTIQQGELNITDPDLTPDQVTFTLESAVSEGQLLVNGGAVDNGDTFTQADINDGNVVYVHDGEETAGSLAVSYSVSGPDNADLTGRSLDISVQAINDTPVVSVPGSQTVGEDTTLTLSGVNAPVLADADAGGATVETTVSAANGTVALNGLTGLSVTDGADGSASVTVQGSIADINAALDGLAYQGNTDFNGPDSIEVTVDDLGESGAGGNQVDSASIAVTVNAVADTPLTGDATLAAVLEDTNEPPGETIANLLVDYSDADGDALAGGAISADGSDPASGAWQFSLDNGESWDDVGTVSSSVALALDKDAHLRFQPAENFNGAVGALTLHAIDDTGSRAFTTDPSSRQTVDTTSGDTDMDPVGGALETTVTAVNDLAEIVTDESLLIDENQTGVIDASVLEIVDVETEADQITFNITGSTLNEGTLFLDSDGSGVADTGEALGNGDSFTQADINAGILKFTHEQDTTGGQQSFDYDVDIGPETLSRTLAIEVSPINDAPVLNVPGDTDTGGTTLSADVIRGESLTFGPANIEVFDVDNTDEQLMFRIEAIPGSGALSLDDGATSAPVNVGSTFSAARLSELVYTNDGGPDNSDSFNVSLRDGAGAVIPSASINLTIQDTTESGLNENRSVQMLEDTVLDLDLGLQIADPNVADFRVNSLSPALSGNGVLFVDSDGSGTLNGMEAAISGGDSIASQAGTDLTFLPNADFNRNGSGSVSFSSRPSTAAAQPWAPKSAPSSTSCRSTTPRSPNRACRAISSSTRARRRRCP